MVLFLGVIVHILPHIIEDIFYGPDNDKYVLKITLSNLMLNVFEGNYFTIME